MRLTRQFACGIFLLGILAALAPAQVRNSGARAIAINAQLNESLTLRLSANAVNFNLVAGRAANPGSTAITATTNWTLNPNRNVVSVYAFFANSAVALTDGLGNNIPSSAFQISNNGGPLRALIRNTPFGAANAGRRVGRTFIFGNNLVGSRTDTMNFNINLTGGTLPNLPPGIYTGTLTIQVQAL